MPLLEIVIDAREPGRGTTGVDPDHLAARCADQPEAVATEPVHVGVDDGDRRGRRDQVAAGSTRPYAARRSAPGAV